MQRARLLLKQDQIQVHPKDKNGDSLLVTACKSGCTAQCIQFLLERWPSVLNDPDYLDDRTPISWACTQASKEVVEALLFQDKIDVNKPASKSWNYTPLHFAAEATSSDVLGILLEKGADSLNAQNTYKETPLELAIRLGRANSARLLLIHGQTSTQVRLDCLKRLCMATSHELHGIMADVLDCIKDDDLNDATLIQLIDLSEDMTTLGPYIAFLERALQRDTWKQLLNPFHKVARAGDLDLMKKLIAYGADPTALDEDNWSCFDYAKTYRHNDVVEDLLYLVQQQFPIDYKQPKYKSPGTLLSAHVDHAIEINADQVGVASHQDCAGRYGKLLSAARLTTDTRL
jgi:ankyrin repeat protein